MQFSKMNTNLYMKQYLSNNIYARQLTSLYTYEFFFVVYLLTVLLLWTLQNIA